MKPLIVVEVLSSWTISATNLPQTMKIFHTYQRISRVHTNRFIQHIFILIMIFKYVNLLQFNEHWSSIIFQIIHFFLALSRCYIMANLNFWSNWNFIQLENFMINDFSTTIIWFWKWSTSKLIIFHFLQTFLHFFNQLRNCMQGFFQTLLLKI